VTPISFSLQIHQRKREGEGKWKGKWERKDRSLGKGEGIQKGEREHGWEKKLPKGKRKRMEWTYGNSRETGWKTERTG